MKISQINLSPSSSVTGSFLESSARSAVIRLLEKLSRGGLLLQDAQGELHFGQSHEEAERGIHATIRVNNPAAFMMLLRNGSLGAGEAYMFGYWETPDLLQVIRLFVLNIQTLQDMDSSGAWWKKLGARVFQALRHNSLTGARANIAAHYDLSNDFFKLFLDPTMAYSAAIYQSPTDTLEQASLNKFRRICERLQLKASDHLLEIGTGWGGLAIYAAKHFGCRVTTTTLSQEQYDYACAWVAREGLQEQITLLKQDYRELEGRFDKLVSVEMIEAVGAQYYRQYFSRCSALLKDDGLMLIQAITISDQRYAASVGTTDFIKRYIFPGGQLPSNAVICAHLASDTDMQLVGMDDITLDYARTLRAWRENFQQSLPAVHRLGFDDVFIRMWRYYLCFCEGGFLERAIHTGQFLIAKPGFRALPAIGLASAQPATQ